MRRPKDVCGGAVVAPGGENTITFINDAVNDDPVVEDGIAERLGGASAIIAGGASSMARRAAMGER